MRDASAQRHGRVLSIPAERGAEWVPRLTWVSPEPIEKAMRARTAPRPASVPAEVNEARWVVQCPDCGGAQLACRSDRRFMCNECGNVAIGGLWRPVDWPAEAEAIEAELAQRPEANQHWRAGETLEQLRDEYARWQHRGEPPEVPAPAPETTTKRG